MACADKLSTLAAVLFAAGTQSRKRRRRKECRKIVIKYQILQKIAPVAAGIQSSGKKGKLKYLHVVADYSIVEICFRF